MCIRDREKKRALFIRGGMYYELKEDFSHALECYTQGGDHAKASELLIRSAQLHPGMGHYQEMEKYYRALPEAELLSSPSLMQGMSCLLYTSHRFQRFHPGRISKDDPGSPCQTGRGGRKTGSDPSHRRIHRR